MASDQVVAGGRHCIICDGSAESGKLLIGTTPITEPDYSAAQFHVCRKCLRNPRVAAETLESKIDRLKRAGQSVAFLEKFVVPTLDEEIAAYRLRINE